MSNNINSKKKITIIGSGLCGMMIALYLARRDYLIEIYEKESRLSSNFVSEKRATALDLSARALLSLSEIGLLTQVISKSVATRNRIISSADGTLMIPHGPDDKHVIYNITRSDLFDILFSCVKKENNIHINFSHELISINNENRILFFKKNNDNTIIVKNYEYVLGCDGINSVIRKTLNNKNKDDKNHSHIYKNATLPFEFSKEKLSTKSMYKWIGKQATFLAHPHVDNNFSITLVQPTGLEKTFSSIFTDESFSHLKSVRKYLFNEFTQQEFSKLKSSKVPCQQKDGFLLLGDAAHGILPFLGQGINCAFEDCRLLNTFLTQHDDNWQIAISNFSKNRQIDTNAIIDMSETEYREFEANYDFIKYHFLEQIQQLLFKRHPQFFKTHRYLLAFTQLPYAKIHRYYQLQQQIADRIYSHFNTIRSIHWELVDKWVDSLFKEFAMANCSHY